MWGAAVTLNPSTNRTFRVPALMHTTLLQANLVVTLQPNDDDNQCATSQSRNSTPRLCDCNIEHLTITRFGTSTQYFSIERPEMKYHQTHVTKRIQLKFSSNNILWTQVVSGEEIEPTTDINLLILRSNHHHQDDYIQVESIIPTYGHVGWASICSRTKSSRQGKMGCCLSEK